MRFQELKMGTKLDIEVSLSGKKVSFHGILVKRIQGDYFSIIIETQTNANQCLSFKGCYISVSVMLAKGPVRWGGCAIQYMKNGYVLYVPNKGVEMERRNALRVEVNVRGTLLYKKMEYPVIIHDISLVGISVEVGDDIQFLKRGEMIELAFSDDEFEFSSVCQIVRKWDRTDRNIFGCTIKEISRNLTKYVAYRQQIAEQKQ